MSQHVKTKCQANFKDFKRFGAFKGLVEQKNVVFNSFLYKLLFANHHKIPQNFKILTFDLKTAQKLQNRKNSIKNSFYKAFIPLHFFMKLVF
jgi:hypothetical protein